MVAGAIILYISNLYLIYSIIGNDWLQAHMYISIAGWLIHFYTFFYYTNRLEDLMRYKLKQEAEQNED